MKVLTWNIKHGGSSRINEILETLFNWNPDLIVLTEFRVKNEMQIRNYLKNAGWHFQLSSNPEPKTNGIFIGCKVPIQIYQTELDRLPNALHRWLNVHIPGLNLYVLGIHIPFSGDQWGKKNFWNRLFNMLKIK